MLTPVASSCPAIVDAVNSTLDAGTVRRCSAVNSVARRAYGCMSYFFFFTCGRDDDTSRTPLTGKVAHVRWGVAGGGHTIMRGIV